MIDLPAHIDKNGWTVDDAKNQVIFIYHWRGVQRTVEKSFEMAQEIVDALNNRDAIASVVSGVPSVSGNDGEVKRPGNPNFKKGNPNPYK